MGCLVSGITKRDADQKLISGEVTQFVAEGLRSYWLACGEPHYREERDHD